MKKIIANKYFQYDLSKEDAIAQLKKHNQHLKLEFIDIKT